MRGLVLCALSCAAGLVAGEIVSPGLGKCLDARLEQKEDAGIKRRETPAELVGRADRDAINVQLYACHEGFNQDFKMLTNGQIQLVGPEDASGKVLCLEAEHLTDSENNNVRLTRCATQGGKVVVATALEKGTKYKITNMGSTLPADWTKVGAGNPPALNTPFTASKDAGTGKACPQWAEVDAQHLVSGTWYRIISPGAPPTDFTAVGAGDSTPGTAFVASGPGLNAGRACAISDEVAATALVKGTPYIISLVPPSGDTDWKLVGNAPAVPAVGNVFTATGTAEAIPDANFEKQVWTLTGLGQLMIGTKCLDVKAAKTADGGREVWSEIKLHEKVNVQLYTCHNPEKTERVNQLWAWQPESFFSTDNWYTD